MMVMVCSCFVWIFSTLLSYAGVLSAYGLGLAEVVQEEQAPMQTKLCTVGAMESITTRLGSLAAEGTRKLSEQGFAAEQIRVQYYLNLRYDIFFVSLFELIFCLFFRVD
jgi:N-methylhydantoinase A/oxoprolinase/acetone carboxylase beta subunit